MHPQSSVLSDPIFGRVQFKVIIPFGIAEFYENKRSVGTKLQLLGKLHCAIFHSRVTIDNNSALYIAKPIRDD